MTTENTEPKDYKKIAADLGSRLIWALKFMKLKGGTGMVLNMKTMQGVAWDDWFMDGLDQLGYVIDREKYREKRTGKPRKKSAPREG